MMQKIKNVIAYLDNKILADIIFFSYLLSMVPIWYLGFFARPSGDDYGYAVAAHYAWLDTHSLIEVIKAAVRGVKEVYTCWNGNWSTVFLYSFMPEVFMPGSYWIIPLIMTLSVIAITYVFIHEVGNVWLKLRKEDCIILSSLILFLQYQYIPSTGIGMYWFVGAVHYMLSYAAGMLAIIFLLKYIRRKRPIYLLGTSLICFFLGGASFFTVLLMVLLFIAAEVVLCITARRKEAFSLMLPIIIFTISFLFQLLAPANNARAGGELPFGFGFVVQTILECLKRGLEDIIVLIKTKTFVAVALGMLVVWGGKMMREANAISKFRYPLPGLVNVFLYGCYSAMYAPLVYSEGVDVQGASLGPATIQYFTFVVTAVFAILYWEGWFLRKAENKKWFVQLDEFLGSKFELYLLLPVFCFVILSLWPLRSQIREMTTIRVAEYVISGQAHDFREQTMSQLKVLLDDEIQEAYVVPTNSEQGPMFHMCLTEDENAWTNTVVKEFYRKEKVVVISSE